MCVRPSCRVELAVLEPGSDPSPDNHLLLIEVTTHQPLTTLTSRLASKTQIDVANASQVRRLSVPDKHPPTNLQYDPSTSRPT